MPKTCGPEWLQRGPNYWRVCREKRPFLEMVAQQGGAVGVDLEQIAADRRGRLTVDECRRSADLLLSDWDA
jgi:hypothetical protein